MFKNSKIEAYIAGVSFKCCVPQQRKHKDKEITLNIKVDLKNMEIERSTDFNQNRMVTVYSVNVALIS